MPDTYVYNGVRRYAADWARELNISVQAFHYRWKQFEMGNKELDQVFKPNPVRDRLLYPVEKDLLAAVAEGNTIQAAAEIVGVTYNVARHCLEEAEKRLTHPVAIAIPTAWVY
jgi:hypothetical protein